MQAATRRQISLIGLLRRRFSRSQSGATAVEFSILAPIFFVILGATLELSMAFFAGQILDSAVNDSARFIRTGQAQTEGWTADLYREEICSRLYFGFDCSELQVSVRVISQFQNFAAGQPVVNPDTGAWTLISQYNPGNGFSIVLVEAYYKWPSITAIPGVTTGLTGDGKRLLAAARIFRNEPFVVGAGTPPPGNT